MFLSRAKLAAVAEEINKQLRVIDDVKALQTGQTEMARAIAQLSDRLRSLELQMSALKSEVKLDALKEAQNVVWTVQTDLNRRVQELAVKVGISEHERAKPAITLEQSIVRRCINEGDGA